MCRVTEHLVLQGAFGEIVKLSKLKNQKHIKLIESFQMEKLFVLKGTVFSADSEPIAYLRGIMPFSLCPAYPKGHKCLCGVRDKPL